MPDMLTLADLDANLEREEAQEIEGRQRTVRVVLAKNAAHRVDLSWNAGGRFGRREPLFLYPGKTVVLPLDRASHFFGPFAWILELGKTAPTKRVGQRSNTRSQPNRSASLSSTTTTGR